jgi:polar amino acid transport system permease protein
LITLGDLAFRAQQMNQTTMRTIPIFTLVLLIYLAISLTITIAMRSLEGWLGHGLARGRGAR